MEPLTDREEQTVRELHAVRLSITDIATWMGLPKSSVRECLGAIQQPPLPVSEIQHD